MKTTLLLLAPLISSQAFAETYTCSFKGGPSAMLRDLGECIEAPNTDLAIVQARQRIGNFGTDVQFGSSQCAPGPGNPVELVDTPAAKNARPGPSPTPTQTNHSPPGTRRELIKFNQEIDMKFMRLLGPCVVLTYSGFAAAEFQCQSQLETVLRELKMAPLSDNSYTFVKPDDNTRYNLASLNSSLKSQEQLAAMEQSAAAVCDDLRRVEKEEQDKYQKAIKPILAEVEAGKAKLYKAAVDLNDIRAALSVCTPGICTAQQKTDLETRQLEAEHELANLPTEKQLEAQGQQKALKIERRDTSTLTGNCQRLSDQYFTALVGKFAVCTNPKCAENVSSDGQVFKDIGSSRIAVDAKKDNLLKLLKQAPERKDEIAKAIEHLNQLDQKYELEQKSLWPLIKYTKVTSVSEDKIRIDTKGGDITIDLVNSGCTISAPCESLAKAGLPTLSVCATKTQKIWGELKNFGNRFKNPNTSAGEIPAATR